MFIKAHCKHCKKVTKNKVTIYGTDKLTVKCECCNFTREVTNPHFSQMQRNKE